MSPDQIELNASYDAVLNIRDIPGLIARPESVVAQGRRCRFIASWVIEPEDRAEYAGEVAMMFDYDHDRTYPRMMWVASGDLTDITPVA